MPHFEFFWIDDNEGHIGEHDVTPEEAEHVVKNAGSEDRSVSRTTGELIAFGPTADGRYLCVVYAMIDKITVYVISAFEAPEKRS